MPMSPTSKEIETTVPGKRDMTLAGLQRKSPDLNPLGPGIPYFILDLPAASVPGRSVSNHDVQVFRVPDLPTGRAFPSSRTVALLRLSSPVTAAGPLRLLHRIPFLGLCATGRFVF